MKLDLMILSSTVWEFLLIYFPDVTISKIFIRVSVFSLLRDISSFNTANFSGGSLLLDYYELSEWDTAEAENSGIVSLSKHALQL